MYVANSHLKIMQSFVSAPQIHVMAMKNPSMRGGPFINYDETKVQPVSELLARTKREQADLLEFAGAINSLTDILLSEASGGSLEPFYEKVPESLKGYVELIYDLNNSPSVRFIEGLLYRSPYYKESLQSIALSACEMDERPFALSTPSFDKEGRYVCQLPFKATELDELFKMRSEPQSFGHIGELLNLKNTEAELFRSFFMEEEPRHGADYTEDKVRVRYYGHACVLIETNQLSIMIDPLVSYENGYLDDRYSYSDLPSSIDYVLITHGHQDHFMLETLLQLRYRIKNIIVPKCNGGALADPSLKLVLRNLGFKQVSEIDELEAVDVNEGSITGLPFLGEHADLNVRTKLAYLVELKGRKIMCAADSNNLEPRLYDHICEEVKSLDVLFLGMECDGGPLSWLYGPLLSKPLARGLDHSRRLNGSDYQRGIEMINRLQPRQVFVYAMGQEPWLSFITSIKYTEESRPITESNRLIESCNASGIHAERLYLKKEIEL